MEKHTEKCIYQNKGLTSDFMEKMKENDKQRRENFKKNSGRYREKRKISFYA